MLDGLIYELVEFFTSINYNLGVERLVSGGWYTIGGYNAAYLIVAILMLSVFAVPFVIVIKLLNSVCGGIYK